MKSREQEYKEIFIAESLEEYEAIGRHLVALERDPQNEGLLDEVFRLLHNLKANARAIGYEDVSEVAHRLETIFGRLRDQELHFSGPVVPTVFHAVDLLKEMLDNLDNPEAVAGVAQVHAQLELILEQEGQDMEEKSAMPLQLRSQQEQIAISELISIPIRKLDNLLNLVGELIIDRDRIISLTRELRESETNSSLFGVVDELRNAGLHLQRITDDIQSGIMDARLVNVGYLFNKFPRIVRDVAVAEQKEVELVISGHEIQIDRNILQIITDSLLHIVRNAITHGIDHPHEREAVGKPRAGKLHLRALSEKENVYIEVEDDGKGIDLEKVRQTAMEQEILPKEMLSGMDGEDLLNIIFEPGFSMSPAVTEYSGRGVGLDIVKTAVDSAGGDINVKSIPGKGTLFQLVLPTSIAVKGALLCSVRGGYYAIPLMHADSVATVLPRQVHTLESSMFIDIKGETLPLVDLGEFFGFGRIVDPDRPGFFESQEVYDGIVVNYNNRKACLLVDTLLRQQDIVVKPLQKPIDRSPLFGGVTLLGKGEICMVLDVPGIMKMLLLRRQLA